MHKPKLVLAVFAILSASTLQVSAQQTQAGMLTCQTSASVGLIVGSHQKIRCRFVPNNGGAPEHYTGAINRVGLDLGVTAGGIMSWAVLASTALYPHALAGKYVGASGDVAFGVGVGANVLIGGSKKSVALQPLSVEGQAGVNLALGVAGLTLQ
jgi:hypothetical protein